MLHEMTEGERQTPYDFTHVEFKKKKKRPNKRNTNSGTESRLVVTRGEGSWGWVKGVKGSIVW